MSLYCSYTNNLFFTPVKKLAWVRGYSLATTLHKVFRGYIQELVTILCSYRLFINSHYFVAVSAGTMMATPTSPPLLSGPSPSKTMDPSKKMKVTPPITSDTSPSMVQPLFDPMGDTTASIPTQPPQPSACPPRFSLKDYIAEAMGKYKDKLVALSTTAESDLPALAKMIKSKEWCMGELTELTELLSKTMELANAYKNASTGMLEMFKEYVAHLKCTDLASLRVSTIKLYEKNLDKLLSDISGAKNVHENYYNSILPLAMKTLKHYEEETIACLRNSSLLETLVEDAHLAKLIPEKVRNIFASLDCNVSHSLKCRYLILHVSKKVAKDLDSFDMWLSLLYKHEGIHSLLDKVKAYYDQSLRASSRVQASMEQLTYLEEKHVSDLTEIIVSNSLKCWKKVAIFLDLPHDLIISIQSANNREVDCLRLILHAWIIQKYDCAKPPTLENLESALFKLGCYSLRRQLRTTMSSVDANKNPRILDQCISIKIHEGSHGLLEVVVSSVSETSLSYQWYKDKKELNDANNCYGSKDHIISIFTDSLIVEGSYTCRIQQGDHVITSEPIVLTVETPLDKYTETLKDIYAAKSEIPEDTWPPVSMNTYINLALIKQQGIDNAGEYARCTIRGDADDVFKDKEKIEYESVFDRLGSGARLLVEGRPGSGKTTLVHKVSKDWAKGELRFDQVRLLFLVHLRGFLSDPNIKLHNILECYFNDDSDSAVDDITKYAHKHNGLGLCFILDGLDEYLPKKKDTYIHRLINKSQLPKALIIVASRPAAVADFRPIASRQIEVLGFLKEQISEYIKEYNFSDNISKCSELLKYLDHHPNVHHMCYLPIHTAMVCFLCQADRSLPETETGIYKEFTIYFFLRTLRQLNDDENIYIDSIESLPSPQTETYMKICKLAFEMTVSSKQVMKQKDVQDFFNVHSNRDYLGLITVDKVALKYGFQKLYTFLHLTFQEFLTAYHISKLEEEEKTKLVDEYGNAKQMQIVWKFYCGLVKFDDCNEFRSLVNNTQTGTLYKVQCSFESQQPNTCDSIVEDGNLSFKDKFLTPSDFTAIAFVISHVTQGTLNRLVFDGCTLGPEGIEALVKKAGEKLSLVTSLCFHGHNCAAEQLKMVNKLIHVLPCLEILDITNTQLGEEAVTALTGSSKHFNLHPNLQVLKIGAIDENDLLNELFLGFKSQCSKVINFWFPDHSKTYLSSSLSLPFYFCSTGNLSDINMSFINLRLVEVKILSDDLKMNSVCKRLSLISCGITDEKTKVLSGGIKCSNIEILELSFNDIGDEGALALAHSIESCLSLHTLNLSCNCVGDDGAMAIVKAIVSKHDKNFSLHLWNNNITKYGANALLQIMANININSLDIDSRNIGSSGAAAVSLSLTKYKNERQALTDALNCFGDLLELNLSCNSIGDDGAKALADALKKCCNIKLTSLNLSSNSIGDDGAKALADALKNCCNIKLTSLNLSSNSIGDDGAKALADALKNCCNIKLTSLNLSSNSIGSDGAKAFVDALKKCCNIKLTSLNLSSNSIGSDGAKSLADVLKHCPALGTLDISDNNICVAGVKALAGALKYCKDLHTLDIACNSLREDGAVALVDLIKHCPYLCQLIIANNDIGVHGSQVLAGAIKNCKNLNILDISNNNIGDEGATALAGAIKQCVKLQTLDVALNHVGKIGTKALTRAIKNCTDLHTLKLSYSNINTKAFATTLGYCSKMSTLHLDHCKLNYSDVRILADVHILADAIKNCRNMLNLNISYNNIGIDGAKILASALKDHDLHSLDVSYNDIGNDGAQALAHAIKNCSNLHTLDVSHNIIGSDGAIAFANVIEHCSNLHTLELSHNDIGYDGIKAIADAIGHCSNLHSLGICHIGFPMDDHHHLSAPFAPLKQSGCLRKSSIDNKKILQDLAAAIRQNSNLYKLDMSQNDIVGSGMKVLADAIKHCSSLHTLKLDHTNIGPEGAEALADAIKCCSNLHTLDVGYNDLGDDGIKVLANALEHCSYLHTLIVSFNKICKEGIQALAKAIKCHSQLHVLDISSNRIGSAWDSFSWIPNKRDGIVALADAIKCCSNLHTLNVGYNNLSDKGVKVLANGLQHCSCLHTLIVCCNEISEDGIQALAGAIKCHSKLLVLDISSNWIGSGDHVVALANAIKCCSNLHTLVINNSHLTGSDFNIVAQALTECSNLHVLNISHNDIGDDGAQGLTHIMKCRKLQSLDISHNIKIKKAAGAIADSLKYCHDLKTLKFDGIGSRGKKILRIAWKLHLKE